MRNSQKIIGKVLMLVFSLMLVGCTNSNESVENQQKENSITEEKGETKEISNEDMPKITFAQGASGNVLVSIAKDRGFFEEEGIFVEEIPLDDGQLQAVTRGQVDIASNSGTWTPIQMIMAGDDMAIIGGNMLTGAMPIIARVDQEWTGPESLLGKKVGASVSQYAAWRELLEAGHDIESEVDLIQMSDEDAIVAIKKGELDFAVQGTNKNYELKNMEDIKIVTYLSDLTPNYSCCRMVARDTWVKENPDLVVKLNTALIRAQAVFDGNKEDVVDLMVEQLGANTDYVEAYLLDEHYRINPDPVKNIVMDNLEYMDKVGGLEQKNPDVSLEKRIYTDLYEEALNTAIEKYNDENPEFFKRAKEFFYENNK